jgi:hypothetical protein
VWRSMALPPAEASARALSLPERVYGTDYANFIPCYVKR